MPSPEYVRLYALAMEWHPLVALPDHGWCVNCERFRLGLSVPAWYRAQRAAWLRSGPALVVLDARTVRRGRAKAEREAKRYRALLERQRATQRKLWMRRAMRKLKREQKERDRLIEEVLTRATQED